MARVLVGDKSTFGSRDTIEFPVSCPDCDKQFDTEYGWFTHVQQHLASIISDGELETPAPTLPDSSQDAGAASPLAGHGGEEEEGSTNRFDGRDGQRADARSATPRKRKRDDDDETLTQHYAEAEDIGGPFAGNFQNPGQSCNDKSDVGRSCSVLTANPGVRQRPQPWSPNEICLKSIMPVDPPGNQRHRPPTFTSEKLPRPMGITCEGAEPHFLDPDAPGRKGL